MSVLDVKTFNTIIDTFKQYTNWHIRRGAVDWSVWDFDAYPQTLAISNDSFDSKGGLLEVGLEFMSVVEDEANPQLDDTLLTDVINTLHKLIQFLKQPTQAASGGWSALIETGLYLELTDVDLRLQGISTELVIRFLIEEFS